VDAHAWPTAIVDASYRDDTASPSPHWAMVISCPTISGLSDYLSLRLTLRGNYKGYWIYNRSGIPVSASRFVKPGVDLALCTEVSRGPLTTADYLRPWAQYHLAVGFQQLLVYVDDKDTSWVENALRKFIRNDQVTIVPFYFGNVSEKNKFLTQGAMESHCLYQARGRAKWIAHSDIDEYFDFIRSDASMRNYKLPKSTSKDVVLVVRNQFWGTLPSSRRLSCGERCLRASYPCNLNAKSQYIHAVYRRSKLIMRPDFVDALFPHFVFKQDGYTELHPDPTTELRLNHFKWCDTSGLGCFGTNQSDACKSETDSCSSKKLMADDGDWQDRCSALLAVNP